MREWLKGLSTVWRGLIGFCVAIGIWFAAYQGIAAVGLWPVTTGYFDERMEPLELYVRESRCDQAERRYFALDRQKRAYQKKGQQVPRDLMDAWQYWKNRRKKHCR